MDHVSAQGVDERMINVYYYYYYYYYYCYYYKTQVFVGVLVLRISLTPLCVDYEIHSCTFHVSLCIDTCMGAAMFGLG